MIRMTKASWLLTGLSVSIALLVGPAAAHAASATVCVFDPSGKRGDAFNLMLDYRTEAAGQDIKLHLVPYTDEKVAVDDLIAGKCHAALMTGVRARGFNKFTGSIEALGAVTSYQQLRDIVRLLAEQQVEAKLRAGDYEIFTVFPAGAVYLYLRDRGHQTISALVGKKIATLDFDDAAKFMVAEIGASMRAADISTFSGMFNNGSVDACYAPATAHAPLQLYKGLGKKGGIVRYPLAQLTFQLVVRNDAKLPASFGRWSRAYAAKRFDKALKLIETAEENVDAGHWISITPRLRERYDQMFGQVRGKLLDEKVYDTTMLALIERVKEKSSTERRSTVKAR